MALLDATWSPIGPQACDIAAGAAVRTDLASGEVVDVPGMLAVCLLLCTVLSGLHSLCRFGQSLCIAHSLRLRQSNLCQMLLQEPLAIGRQRKA